MTFTRLLLALGITFAFAQTAQADTLMKPRTVVTTDGEVDDQDSFKRYLLYTNDLDTVAIVYSASKWHWKGDGKGTLFTSPTNSARYGTRADLRWPGETWIQEDIARYGQVYSTLSRHDPNYPTPEHLQSLVKVGNIEFEGDMAADTPGSDLIKSLLLDDNPRPLDLEAWGGINTIARALKSIQDSYQNTPQWPAIYAKVSKKAHIYDISDQDITYMSYVAPNWPDIRYILNASQYNAWGYAWRNNIPTPTQTLFKGPWMLENILTNHGPLLQSYYYTGDGRQIQNDPEHTQGNVQNAINQGRVGDMISEGDNPSYLLALDIGLLDGFYNPNLGGWGGRFTQNATIPARWRDGVGGARDVSPFTTTTTTLVLPAAPGAATINVASVGNIVAGDTIDVDGEARAVSVVGTAQGAATTLFGPAAVGDATIKVGSVNGFAVGQKFLLEGETPTVTAVGTAGRATTLSAAAAVGATNLKVASVTGLVVGDTLSVDAEQVKITAIGTQGAGGTGVDVTPAVAVAHASGVAVRDQSQAGTGITFAPALSAAHAMNTATRGAGSGLTLATPLSNAHASGASLTDKYNSTYPTARFFEAVEHDFAARADWNVSDFAHANHAPKPSVDTNALVMPPGRRVTLHGSATDPDGNAVAWNWWQYGEVDSYPGAVTIDGANTAAPSFTVPADAKPGETIHLIAEAKDNGTPALTRYQRAILTVGTPVSGGVGGTVPPTLALTLGAPATFGAFTPGVAKDYTATTSANVVSTAGDASLTVDGGRLANGAFTLAQPLDIAFSKSSWNAPVSNDQVTVTFKQAIGANEALRTGTYTKTLTFTLSTTTP